jgi:hypothetical protein
MASISGDSGAPRKLGLRASAAVSISGDGERLGTSASGTAAASMSCDGGCPALRCDLHLHLPGTAATASETTAALAATRKQRPPFHDEAYERINRLKRRRPPRFFTGKRSGAAKGCSREVGR